MEALHGATALVTGASSGIGKETTIRLADKGLHVIAAARRLEKLEELAQTYIDRSIEITKRAIEASPFKKEDIDDAIAAFQW